MASVHRWIGADQPVGKSEKLIMVAPTTDKIYTMTSGEATATYVALSTDAEADVIVGLIAAAGAVGREFSIITFVLDPDPLVLDTMFAVAKITGHEFNLTTNAEITQSSETTAGGPHHWAADNFDTGELPTNGDTVIFEKNSVDLLFNLDQGSLTGINLEFRASYTGKVGLPSRNSAGGFPEYRDQWLKINADDIKIGFGEGNGSSRIKLDLDAEAAPTFRVVKTGSSGNVSLPALQIQNATAIDMTIDDGEVIFGPYATGPVTTIDTLEVGGSTNVLLGDNVTVTLLDISGSATVTTEDAITTIDQTGGTVIALDASVLTTVAMAGGLLDHQSSGNITTLTIDDGAVADFSNTMVTGCTVATLSLKDGRFIDPHGRTTVTAIQDFKSLRTA